MSAEPALVWLVAAGAAIWLGIGCYLALLAARQSSLARRIRQMEIVRDDSK